MDYQTCFKRYEWKYIVTQEQKRRLMQAMEPYMRPDEYGRSIIGSLYLDTPEHLLIRRSLEKPVYKEKLRLRSYGPAKDDGSVFLELKKKYQGVVYKRRIRLPYQEAMEALTSERPLGRSGQIAEEIEYARRLYRPLLPSIQVSYARTAFYGRSDPELRITLDESILWRSEELDLRGAPYGTPILRPGQSLVEIKLTRAMPLWLAETLSENGIVRTSFSKCGTAYCQLMRKTEGFEYEYEGGKRIC